MRYYLAIPVALALAALVTVSLIHQATRPPTLGEQLHAALQKSAGPLPPVPVLLDYAPPPRQNMLLLTLANQSLGIDRQIHWLQLTGDVRPPELTPADGGIRLMVPGRTLGLSPDVARVAMPAGPGPWTLTLAGPGYRLTRTQAPGGVRALLTGPLAEISQSILAQALRPLLSWTQSPAQLVAAQRQALEQLGEFDLFQELLAADPARLDRATDAATAARRALPLLIPARGSTVLRWPHDAAFALTAPQKTTTNESRIDLFGFAEDAKGQRVLTWSGTAYFEPKVPPEEVRRIISGMVPGN